jgi:hypothetical protein
MAKIFLAGIIQGSISERAIHAQDYRGEIKRLLTKYAPKYDFYCPIANHPESLDYAPDHGLKVFLDHIEMARASDVLLAYIPQASMGTAIEMWEAHNAGRLVITISPLAENWTIKFLSDLVLPDIPAFESFLASGGLDEALYDKVKTKL